MDNMTAADFRERIAGIIGVEPHEERPCVRKPTDRGYYPPEQINGELLEALKLYVAESEANRQVPKHTCPILLKAEQAIANAERRAR